MISRSMIRDPACWWRGCPTPMLQSAAIDIEIENTRSRRCAGDENIPSLLGGEENPDLGGDPARDPQEKGGLCRRGNAKAVLALQQPRSGIYL